MGRFEVLAAAAARACSALWRLEAAAAATAGSHPAAPAALPRPPRRRPRALRPSPPPASPLTPPPSYFLSPKPELVSELEGDIKAGQDQLAELSSQKERGEKALADTEREVAEIARDSPAAAAALRRMMGGT
jgi:hypothetical protein